MTHRVVVNTSDGQTAVVFRGDETICMESIKRLPGTPFLDSTGKQVGTIEKAWVEEDVTG